MRCNTLTEGSSIAIGVNALINAQSPGNNIAIGQDAIGNAGGVLTGSYNIAIGTSTLNSAVLTSATKNVILGFAAGGGNLWTSGSNDVCIGYFACGNTSTSNQNTAVGFGTLQNQNSAGNNTCFGYQTCYNVSGGNNVIGLVANARLSALTSGFGNIMIGVDMTLPECDREQPDQHWRCLSQFRATGGYLVRFRG